MLKQLEGSNGAIVQHRYVAYRCPTTPNNTPQLALVLRRFNLILNFLPLVTNV